MLKEKPKKPVPVFNSETFVHTEQHELSETMKKLLSWQDYLVIEEPLEVPTLIKIGNVDVCTQGNHSLIIGKKKSRKTLFIVWLISEYLKNGGSPESILIADTEQGRRHVWKMKEKIRKMSGKSPDAISLRGLSPEERSKMIAQAITEKNIKILVIDGIRDLLSNINDPDQCTRLVTWVEALTVDSKIHIINVLHLNKTDNNPRGHIGTELMNKAEVTIELELDHKAGCSIVRCESARDIPFEPFAIRHDEQGLPEVLPKPIKGNMMTEKEEKKRLFFVFNGELLQYNEVIAGIKEHFEVGISKAGQLKGRFERDGWIVKNGKEKSRDAVYKLMIGMPTPDQKISE